MHTYVIWFLMFVPPQPGALPVYTAERFANPVDCEVRVVELRTKAPAEKYKCQKITSMIDLSKPIAQEK